MIAFIVFPILNALYDYNRLKQKLRIYHTLEVLIRGIVILIISLFSINLVTSFFLGASIFWIIFEIVLNLLRKKEILYVGYSAWTDRTIRKLFSRNPEISLLIIKLITLTICLIAHFG